MKKLLLVLSLMMFGLTGCYSGGHRDDDLIKAQEHQRGHKDHDRRHDDQHDRDHDHDHDEKHDGRY